MADRIDTPDAGVDIFRVDEGSEYVTAANKPEGTEPNAGNFLAAVFVVCLSVLMIMTVVKVGLIWFG